MTRSAMVAIAAVHTAVRHSSAAKGAAVSLEEVMPDESSIKKVRRHDTAWERGRVLSKIPRGTPYSLSRGAGTG